MQNWSSKEELFPGVWVYRNVSGLDMNLIQRLEDLVEESKGRVEWQEAMVGYMEKKPDYRDCQDIKVGPIDNPANPIQEKYNQIWKDSK